MQRFKSYNGVSMLAGNSPQSQVADVHRPNSVDRPRVNRGIN